MKFSKDVFCCLLCCIYDLQRRLFAGWRATPSCSCRVGTVPGGRWGLAQCQVVDAGLAHYQVVDVGLLWCQVVDAGL